MKILTELLTNSDDSYRRLGKEDSERVPLLVLFDRAKRKFSVIDLGEGMTDKDMEERFVTYGKESLDRPHGHRTRSLFGKGLRDVLFTQKNGQVKSIKDGHFYNCRFKWKDDRKPVIDIKAPSRVTSELRKALRIPENGTLVEFVLAEGVPNPLVDRLISILSNFYMLRMINSTFGLEDVCRATHARSG